MNDKTLARGFVLLAISLAFGLQSLRYPIGTLARAGPGLFPLGISGMLGVIALVTLFRARFVEREPLEFTIKNIVIILGSLCSFMLVSRFINMTAGIVVLVFIASFAATTYSIPRNLKISAVLLAIAYAFYKLLGLNLPLY